MENPATRAAWESTEDEAAWEIEDDPLAMARGVVWGLGFSLIVWTLIGVGLWEVWGLW